MELCLNCYNTYFNILKHQSYGTHIGEFLKNVSQGKTKLKFTHVVSKETRLKENI